MPRATLSLEKMSLVRQIVLERKHAGPFFVLADIGQVLFCNAHGPVEQGFLDRGCTGYLGDDARMDLFINARHAHEESGPDLAEVLQELFHALGKGHLMAEEDRAVVSHRPLQGVGQREE